MGPLRGRMSSKFWILLLLASVIATAGVIADSTATVIGAMIVAPLMTPILGTALAVVLADREHVVRSVLLVVGGALVVIAIGFIMGLPGCTARRIRHERPGDLAHPPQAHRPHRGPGDGDRSAPSPSSAPTSPTRFPGWRSRSRWCPPLAVVGLLLSVQRYSDAAGAALLFGTNVAAIIATGAAVFLGYRIRQVAREGGIPVGHLRGRSLVVVASLVALVAIPLTAGSIQVAMDQLLAAKARPVAEAWASQNRWLVTTLNVTGWTTWWSPHSDRRPTPTPRSCAPSSTTRAWATSDLTVRLVIGGSVECPAGGRAVHSVRRVGLRLRSGHPGSVRGGARVSGRPALQRPCCRPRTSGRAGRAGS